MSEIKDGGSAFPLGANEYAGHGPCWGMTLRDYFAAKAMAAIIAMPDEENDGEYDEGAVAMNAYAMANAMIKAREQA